MSVLEGISALAALIAYGVALFAPKADRTYWQWMATWFLLLAIYARLP